MSLRARLMTIFVVYCTRVFRSRFLLRDENSSRRKGDTAFGQQTSDAQKYVYRPPGQIRTNDLTFILFKRVYRYIYSAFIGKRQRAVAQFGLARRI